MPRLFIACRLVERSLVELTLHFSMLAMFACKCKIRKTTIRLRCRLRNRNDDKWWKHSTRCRAMLRRRLAAETHKSATEFGTTRPRGSRVKISSCADVITYYYCSLCPESSAPMPRQSVNQYASISTLQRKQVILMHEQCTLHFFFAQLK